MTPPAGPYTSLAEQVRRRREASAKEERRLHRHADSKVCSNCEGEGLVVVWGQLAHEVPASRQRHYPRDYPAGDIFRKGERPYRCPSCQGTGRTVYDG